MEKPIDERTQELRELFDCTCNAARDYAELTQYCYADCDCVRWDDMEHTPECIGERARRWIESPEGQAAVAEGLKKAEEMSRQFREAQRIKDWTIRFQPMTI